MPKRFGKAGPLLKSWSLGMAALAALGLTAAHPAHAQGTLTVSPGDSVTVGSGSTDFDGTTSLGSDYRGADAGATTGAGRGGSVDGGSLTVNSGATFTGGTGDDYAPGGGRGLSVQGGTVNITGGTFTGGDGAPVDSLYTYIFAHNGYALHTSGGDVNITGGVFNPGLDNSLFLGQPELDVEGGTVTLYGTFTNFTGAGVVTNGEITSGTGTFDAVLADGQSQTFTYGVNFNNSAGGGQLVLDSTAAPEPSSMAAFGFTALFAAGLILNARRRKAVTAA